ncbi:MAG: MBL fold metallo-hydrolase [Deltaproteobacteria bacterium]|jgi:endoribonuclease LACTB2|nr:MBL fold metallo-hydrolase [Deltaproteobacteria bacterium]MBT6431509.1 MBL fold metallo-hydrolase [Deltaproteobacteria bacterium]MBT6488173.1 MBL fold metallo-hydrolase [Deltaproteobacteria bacterium]
MSSHRLSACVILLRPSTKSVTGTEFYLVRRSTSLQFMGGFQVFPGGTVDPIDHEIKVSAEPEQSAMYSCAARELLEETGVLIAHGPSPSPEDLASMREKLLKDGNQWKDLLEKAKLSINAKDFIDVGRWVTPPYTPVRYDAIYFAAMLPEGQKASIIPGELTDGLWLSPEDAISAHNAGEAQITYPVLETLRELVEHRGELMKVQEVMGQRKEGRYSRPGGEILTGIHVIPMKTFTLPPATHTNTYVLGTDEIVIIDPSSPIAEEQDKLIEYLRYLETQGGCVKEIWLTHQHGDHVGAVNRIRSTFNIPVRAHPLTEETLPPDIAVDGYIEADELLILKNSHGKDFRWRAIHTPGHARGHFCFYEENSRSLISGDLILGLGTVVINPPEGNMVDYFASLRGLLELPLGFTFPAHGPPIAASVAKINFYIEHRLMREKMIFEAIEGEMTPAQIVPIVYTEIPEAVYPLAELNVRAHLEKLVSERRVVQNQDSFQVPA